jgi:hypothetical protein
LDGRQGIIMNSVETTAESNEEICALRARAHLYFKMEKVEEWQKCKFPHCRKLCFLLCASPLQSPISSHGPEQTWRRLWLTRRSLGLTGGCPWLLYVCMCVSVVQQCVPSRSILAPRHFMFCRSPWRKVGPRQPQVSHADN